MITITIENDEDVLELFNIIQEIMQINDCMSGECDCNEQAE